MLLPPVANGIATYFDMADVISIVADGIATLVGMLSRQILLPWLHMEKPLGQFILILVLCC